MLSVINRIPHLLFSLLLLTSTVLLQGCFWESDDPAPPTYSIGGTVSGLVGSGMVLQNNGGDDLTIDADGNFSFNNKITEGSDYAVTIITSPSYPAQSCHVTNGSGKAAAAVTNISISCSTPANQDASGIYTTGNSLTVADGSGGQVTYDDVKAMIYDKRFLIFSINAHVLYDGMITNINSTDFTATAKLYLKGLMVDDTVTVTGQVISESKVSGTLAGTHDKAKGEFSLLYDLLYKREATVARLETGVVSNLWKDVAYAETDKPTEFNANTSKGFSGITTSLGDKCLFDGLFDIAVDKVNIFSLSGITIGTASGTCVYADASNKYDGFATVIDGASEDNTAFIGFTNGSKSVFGVFTKQ